MLEGFYRALSGHVVTLISVLGGWETVTQAQRDHLMGYLGESVPRLAVGQYEELFRRLANDCPEFAIWAGMSDHQATRAELRHGLAGLRYLLESITSGRVPDQRRAALSRSTAPP